LIAWIPDAAVGTEVVALIAALSVPRPRPPAIHLLAIYFAVSLTEDAAASYWATHFGNNLWLEYFESPLNALLILWSFVPWQRSDIARMSLRIAAVLYAFTCLILLLTVEHPTQFGTYSYPIQSLLILGVALYTLVTKARATDEPLAGQDWFWICVGWCMGHLFTVVLFPVINALLLAGEIDKLRFIYGIRIIAYGVGILCIAIGLVMAGRASRGTQAALT
jgi:hypothetical protein